MIYGRRIWRVWRVFLGCDGIILGLFVWLWLLIKINGVDNLSDVMDSFGIVLLYFEDVFWIF